ncbi:MAG: RNA polymerase factor sigma-54 [Planctomycetota bacterium]
MAESGGMRLETGLGQRMEMRLKLSPQMIQSMQILQLPTMALEERIKQELEENPVLEIDETERVDRPAAEPRADVPAPAGRDDRPDWGRSEFMDDGYRERRTRGTSVASGDELDAMQLTEAPAESLQDHLVRQLAVLAVSPELQAPCRTLIEQLDDSGYLRTPLADIAGAGADPAVTANLESALHIIQGFDPPGVGARDTKECLLLQLADRGEEADLARRIIRDHIENIQANRIPQVARATGRPMAEVQEAIALISHLRLSPGSDFHRERVHYVVPDVIVEFVEGEYQVTLRDGYVPRLLVSQTYRGMLADRKGDRSVRDFIRKKVGAANWFIDAIEQRRVTIYKISGALVNSQRKFLEEGLSGLRPLRMQDIADSVGINVSTVSRAIQGKYIQTPRGIFKMRFFFQGGTASVTAEGESEESSTGLQLKIREVLASENTAHPLSDDDIMEKLKTEGLQVARRTVTKYRKIMGVPSSRMRKKF